MVLSQDHLPVLSAPGWALLKRKELTQNHHWEQSYSQGSQAATNTLCESCLRVCLRKPVMEASLINRSPLKCWDYRPHPEITYTEELEE